MANIFVLARDRDIKKAMRHLNHEIDAVFEKMLGAREEGEMLEKPSNLRFVVRRIEEDGMVVKRRILQQAVEIDEAPGYKWVDVPEVNEDG
jgi:hypothetical protein